MTDRIKTLWPMPGGTGHYSVALTEVIALASRTGRMSDVEAHFVATYGITSNKAVRSYSNVAQALGFIEIEPPNIYVTDAGRQVRESGLPVLLRSALLERIWGCEEIVETLKNRPRTLGRLAVALETTGIAWRTTSQLRYRLRWLEEAGLVVRSPDGRPQYSAAN